MSEDMDDKQLREAFDEYLDGVQPPPASVTEKAKNEIRRQNARYSLVKRIAVGAACAACACLVTLGVVYSPIIGIGGNKADVPNDGADNMGNMNVGDNKPSSSDPPGSGTSSDNASVGITYYPESGLSATPLNIYGELPAGMNFVKTANLASNFVVTDIKGYYDGQTLAYAQTEITASINGTRQEATVYAEYVSGTTCEIFEDYLDGNADFRQNVYYRINSVQENGEWVSKVYMPTEDVKYYFTVKSSDKNAYTTYMDLILAKK